MGETIAPKNIPNLNHNLFSGVNNLELRTPKIKKIIDKANDHNLISPSYFKGHKATIKNTTKNTKPKLRFDDIFISDFDFMIKYKLYLIIYFAIPTEKKSTRRPIPLSIWHWPLLDELCIALLFK